MINKLLSYIKNAFLKVDEVMTFDFPNCKNKNDEQKN